jgi:hypothetical protein
MRRVVFLEKITQKNKTTLLNGLSGLRPIGAEFIVQRSEERININVLHCLTSTTNHPSDAIESHAKVHNTWRHSCHKSVSELCFQGSANKK